MIFYKKFYFLIFGVFFIAHSVLANTVVDDDISYITEFATLDDDIASASLVWTLNSKSKEQNRKLQAFLAAKINGPIGRKSVREIIDFRIINDINFSIDATSNHLILTVQSQKESFALAASHTNEIIKNTAINETWLKRKNYSFRNISSTKLRTPELLENELISYVLFTGSDEIISKDSINLEISRRPNQIIFNARNFEFNDITNILLKDLPTYNAILNDEANKPFHQLPHGVIHLEDEEATETLIFIGTVQSFNSLIHQAETNTLFKYMGYGAGSEMFRIIRQEKRASYDPRSHFNQISEKLAFTGLSATVASETWDEIHNLMYDIYNNTRMGLNTRQGLKNSHNIVINELITNLRKKPNWLVKRYLELHPDQPPETSINLELINASFDVSPDLLNNKAVKTLSDPSNLISIIIGGKINNKIRKDDASYCQLPKGKSLAFCLEKLTKAQDSR